MPHVVTHSLASWVRDCAIALVRCAGELAEIDVTFDGVEVDSDEVEIRGKISRHLHHHIEVHWFQMRRQFLLGNIAREGLIYRRL
jgi:hypothetical protein